MAMHNSWCNETKRYVLRHLKKASVKDPDEEGAEKSSLGKAATKSGAGACGSCCLTGGIVRLVVVVGTERLGVSLEGGARNPCLALTGVVVVVVVTVGVVGVGAAPKKEGRYLAMVEDGGASDDVVGGGSSVVVVVTAAALRLLLSLVVA